MFRRFLAGLLVFIFIHAAFLASLIFGIRYTFFERDFYNEAFIDGVYDLLTDVSVMFVNGNKQLDISEAQIRSIVEESVSRNGLELTVNKVIDQIQDLKVNKNGEFSIVIPMDWLNKDTIKTRLNESVFSNIPSQYVFNSKVPPEVAVDGNVTEFFTKLMSKIILATVLIIVLLLVLIGLVVFHPFVRILKWEFSAIFFASISIVSFFGLIAGMPKLAIEYINRGGLPEQTIELLYLYLDAFKVTGMILSKNILYYTVPISIISFVGWIIAIIYDRKNN